MTVTQVMKTLKTVKTTFVKISPQTTVNTKVGQAMKKLQTLYNNNANKIVEQAMNKKGIIKNLKFFIDLSLVTTNIESVPEEPKTFVKARNHPNPNSCAIWQEAIKKEFANMNNQQVWCKTGKSLMPPN